MGWEGGITVARGSPAHAGIDRYTGVMATYGYRFPRTRGDRPRFVMFSQGLGKVPPHTRG